jgi:uncharacterized Rossmann fold enzyme
VEFWEWEPYYRQILRDFGFDRRRDERAAHILSAIIPPDRTALPRLRNAIRGQDVTVLGNGPGLAAELQHARGTVIAADEAVSTALRSGILPEVVVTDRDGRIDDLLEASEKGSLTVIHAHGDNIPALREWAYQFSRPCIGTTQSKPFAQIHNFGGFTDGDRAAFLADHFGAKQIRLIGFDFERPNPKDSPVDVKKRKLRWARKLISILQTRATILYPGSSSSK